MTSLGLQEFRIHQYVHQDYRNGDLQRGDVVIIRVTVVLSSVDPVTFLVKQLNQKQCPHGARYRVTLGCPTNVSLHMVHSELQDGKSINIANKWKQ